METHDWRALLTETTERAIAHLESLPERPVGPRASHSSLRAALGVELQAEPLDPRKVVADLVDAAGPGLMGTPSGRFFGWVIGGALPAALAADWLTATWDQNNGLYYATPAGAVVEEVAAGWLLELLDLPRGSSVGFVTGGQMANTHALLIARDEVLRRAGWDAARQGLIGAPDVTVVVGEDRHATIDTALRWVGLGSDRVLAAAADDQGRMRTESLRAVLADVEGPLIVCAQAGNVNSGAFDPLGEVADLTHEKGGWLHVDGAVGLWARACESVAPLAEGAERADSWSTDPHKWLNVPYDCGLLICAHPDAHRRATAKSASYLLRADGRDASDWVMELSRRARGFTVYAALRSLGRQGLTDLVERCCARARQAAELFRAADGVEVLNDVVLNQVLVRFGDDDELTRDVVRRAQEDGTCWVGAGLWRGRAVMRFSVSNWSTDTEDINRSVAAILQGYHASAD